MALWVEHLSAGTFTTRSFLYETSFMAGAINPLAAYFVAAGAAVYFLGKALFETEDTSRDARQRIDELAKSLEALGDKSQGIHRVADAVADLSGAAVTQGKIEIGLDVETVKKQVEDARTALLSLSKETIKAVVIVQTPPTAPLGGVTQSQVQVAGLTAASSELAKFRTDITDSKISLDDAAQSAAGFAQRTKAEFPSLVAQADALQIALAQLPEQLAIHPEQEQALRAQAGALVDQFIVVIESRRGDVQASFAKTTSLGGKAIDPEFIQRVEVAQAAFSKLANSANATTLLKSLNDLRNQGGKNIDDTTQKVDDLIRKLQEFLKTQSDLQAGLAIAKNPALFGRDAATEQAGELARRQAQARPEARLAAEPASPVRAAISGVAAENEDLVKRRQLLEQQGRSETAIAAILAQEKDTNTKLTDGEVRRLAAMQSQVDAAALTSAELAKQQQAVAALPQQIKDLANQNAIAQLPTQEMRDLATEAALVGKNLADVHTPADLERVLNSMPRSLRLSNEELARLKQQARDIQFGGQVQQVQNQNVAALLPPGRQRFQAQALLEQGIDLTPRGAAPVTTQAQGLRR